MKTVFKSILMLMITAFTFYGCSEDDEGNNLPQVVAGFTHNINHETGVVTFINTSENADTYFWEFGDQAENTSTEVNPTHQYPSGSYTVKLTANNVAGASDIYEDVIMINIPVPMSIPFNFDDANTVYNNTTFNGASFEIIENPLPGGSNDVASMVGAITNDGANWEGVYFDLANPVDLSMDMTIQLDFLADAAVDVLMKLEQGTGADTQVVASHSGSGWENLIFTFDSASAYSRVTLFVDGPGTTAGTFYLDNVRQTSTVDVTIPVITLLGDNPLMLDVGDMYMEPGATASDDTDGDITASIVIDDSAVDSTTPGTYLVTYNVMDAAGNAAAELTREVIVAPCSETNNLELTIDFDCSTIDYATKIVGNVNFTVVANPDQSGANDAETMVGQITNAGVNWENAFFNLDTAVDFATDKGIKMKMWADQAVPVLLKFEDGTEGPTEMTAQHTGSGWEELSFTLDSAGAYNDMVIFVDGPGNTAGTFYVDHIEQFEGNAMASDAPTMAAPAPTQDAANVSGVYGDTYTNTATNYDPNWGQSGHTMVDPAYDTGDGTVLAYPNFNYQGTLINGETPIDLSAMEYLHVDIWVAEGTDRMVKVSPINNGTGANEVLVELPLTPGAWNSVDLPKSAFAGQTWDAIFQMKFDGQFNGDGTANTEPFDIYLDNVYFWKEAGTTSDAPTMAAPAPTQDAANVSGVYGDTYTNTATNYDPNWGQSGHTMVDPAYDTGDGTVLAYPNFNYQGTLINGETPIDLSAMEYLHVDIWVAEGTDRMVKVSPINNGTGANEVLVELPLTPGAWNSVDLPKSAFAGQTWDAIFQMKFDGQFNGDGTANTEPFDIYLDNVYFWKEAGMTGCTDTMLQIPIDFDCEGIDYASKQTGDIVFALVDNPDASGANPTVTKVAQTVWDNNQPWENMFFTLDSPIDFNNGSTIKLKMWSDSAQPVLLKFEQGVGGATNTEVPANHGGTGWEELSFEFNSTDAYSALVLFVNGGGATSGTFYFDDIIQTTGGGGGGGGETGGCTNGTLVDAADFPVDFEGCESFLSTFTDVGSITTENVANPSMTGNTSDYVLKITKAANTNIWAGAQNNFASTFPDISNRTFKAKVYVTEANASIRFEVAQDENGIGNPPPTFVTVPNANTWTEVEFSFTGIPAPEAYFRLVIKPGEPEGADQGALTTSEVTYYFDDIELN